MSREGVIYFSDASSKYGLEDDLYDILEGRPNGRLLEYNINTRTVRVLLDGLYFANGVELSPDQIVVYVTETARFRVLRYYLKGEKAGQSDILIDNLPGAPDNIRFNDEGEAWIALPQMRNKITDYVTRTTYVRNLMGKLPLSIAKRLVFNGGYTGGVKVDTEGKVLEFLQGESKAFSFVTTVLEKNGTLYLGTIHHHDIGIIKRGD